MQVRYPLLGILLAIGTVSGADNTLSLNGDWRFLLAPDASAEARLEHFHESGFDASPFRPLPVPSNWAMHGWEEPIYGTPKTAGVGFYRHRFPVPAEMQGRRVLLHFGGVWASAEVWLNGHWLGRHDSGFTSFAFAVENVLEPGKENTLAVKVRQVTRDSQFDVNDDWSLGGIFRDVWLESMPSLRYLDRVDHWTTFDGAFRDATLHVRALVNEARTPIPYAAYELRATLSDADGKVVARTIRNAPSHRNTGREHEFTMDIPAAHAWTAETPYLYNLKVELVEPAGVAQARESHVGLRQVSTAGGVLRVNGQAIRLRGACRHDEHPDVGIATRREHWIEDIRLMKAANINAIRSVHYPPAEGFLELCDQLGMWVLAEVPMGYGGDLATDPSYAGAAMLRAYETVARDRNHPAIIIWDIGNENPVTAVHLGVLRAVKGMDPTRPLLFPWHPEEWLPRDVDILAPHYPTAKEAEAMVARADRPVVATEFSHALGEFGFGGHADRWAALTGSPAGAGGAIWMWQDQGLWQTRDTPTGRKRELLLLPAGTDGIVRSDRTPQRDYWETKAVYSPTHVILDRLDVAPEQRLLRVPVRNDYDFTDLSTVSIEWQLFAGERALAAGKTHLSAAPHTTAVLEIPLDALAAVRQDEARYLHLVFNDPQGQEISRHSVELVPRLSAPEPKREWATIRSTRNSLVAGAVTYTFDPSRGTLSGITRHGRKVLAGMQPVLWRPLNWVEKTNYQRRNFDADALPDLEQAPPTVHRWQVHDDSIEADVEYTVNANNRYQVAWRYTLRGDGVLDVSYRITTHVVAHWLPEVGVELSLPGGLEQLRWLGLGWRESYPNEKAAAMFGVWKSILSDEVTTGMKHDVRWAEVSGANGAKLRIDGCGNLRVSGPDRLRILSAVEGRPTKFVRGEKPEYRVDVTAGTVLSGAFRLSAE